MLSLTVISSQHWSFVMNIKKQYFSAGIPNGARKNKINNLTSTWLNIYKKAYWAFFFLFFFQRCGELGVCQLGQRNKCAAVLGFKTKKSGKSIWNCAEGSLIFPVTDCWDEHHTNHTHTVEKVKEIGHRRASVKSDSCCDLCDLWAANKVFANFFFFFQIPPAVFLEAEWSNTSL